MTQKLKALKITGVWRGERREGGFTLVELMVALFVGAIVIWGIYAIFSGSQRIFHEEQRVSQAQLTLRLGMDIVKNDIKRAGFQLSPNVYFDPLVCRDPTNRPYVRLHPIVHVNGTAGQVYDRSGNPVSIPNPDRNTGLAPDAIFLAGNYLSTQSYMALTINPSRSIVLQDIRRRILPGTPPPWTRPTPTGAEFRMEFPAVGAYLRVVNKYGFMMFTRLTGASATPPWTLDFDIPLPTMQEGDRRLCGVDGYGEGSEVNVVNSILYRIEVDPNDTSGQKTDLVRWQVDEDRNLIPNTREVVIEYAIDFQVWFREDNPIGALPGRPNIAYRQDVPPDEVVIADSTSPPLDGSPTARPERLRVAIIRLSVRTDTEDPTFPWVPRGAGPLTRFELNRNAVGAAHVRTLVEQVELPNIAKRNLR